MPGYTKGLVPVQQPGPELYCSQCSLLLREAMLTEEGDRVCKSCYEELKRDCVWWCLDLACKPDSAVDEEIAVLQVHCPNSSMGCLWKGDLKDMEEHVSSCDYQPWPCPNKGCGRLISIEEKEGHKKTCVYRSVSCQNCKQTLMANQLEAHHTLCRARRQEISITTGENAPFRRIVKIGLNSLSPVQPRPAMKPGRVPGLSDYIRQDCLPYRAIASSKYILGCENPVPLRSYYLDNPHDTLCYRSSTPPVDSLGRPHARKRKLEVPCSKNSMVETVQPFGHNQTNGRIKTRTQDTVTGRPEIYTYEAMCEGLKDLENTLRRCTSVGPEFNVPVITPSSSGASFSSFPKCAEHKRQKCFSEGGGTSVIDSWARKVKKITDRMMALEKEIRNQRSELHRQRNKAEELEKTLSELQHVMAGQGDFGEPQITKRVYHKCITKIHDWIDVEGMLPQLMEHNVISGRDDMHRITHGSPRENLNYLYTKLCGCKNGFQLFYQCLRESQSDRLGHRDAADKLEETARNTGPGQAHQCSL